MGKLYKNAFLISLIIISLLFSNLGVVYGQNVEQGSDIENSWAREQISGWLDQGLITGYADKTFKPGNSISRAEFVTIVNRAFGFSDKAEVMFKDVSKDKWYYDEILKAKFAGYISGFEDGSFRPEANVSRQEAAKIIYELMKLDHVNDESALAAFQDNNQIPNWSRPYINAVYASGYINGYPDQTLRPVQSITRAEAVGMLDKVVGKLIQSAGTVGVEEKQTIRGNVTINTAGVTLKNTIIEGDLHLAAGIGQGEVYLNQVTVQGRTIVAGGGENSIIIIDSMLKEAIVDKVKGKVRLLAKGDTEIIKTIVKTAVKLQAENKGKGFIDVEIINDNLGENIQLQGEFKKILVKKKVVLDILQNSEIGDLEVEKEAEGSIINIQDGGILQNMVLNAATNVKGTGIIKIVIIKSDGSSFEQNVERYELAEGVVSVIIGGVVKSENPVSTDNVDPIVSPQQGSDPTPTPSPTPSPDPNSLPKAEAVIIIGDKVFSYFEPAGDYSDFDLALFPNSDTVSETVYNANYYTSYNHVGEFTIEEGVIPAAEYVASIYNDSSNQFQFSAMLDTITVNDAVYGYVYYSDEGIDTINYKINDYFVSDLNNQLHESAVPLADGDMITLLYGDQLVLQATWSGTDHKWVFKGMTKGLPAPANVSAQPVSNKAIDLQWDTVLDAVYYHVYYSDTPDGIYIPVMDSLGEKANVTDVTYHDGNNLPHTTRYYKITAVMDGFDLESQYSEIASATTYYNEHLELDFNVTDTVQDPSKPIIYVTDKANKKLYAINYETKVMTSLTLDLPPESITYANGELFIALLKMDHSSYALEASQQGAIAIVDPTNLTIKATMNINTDPYDIAVDRNGYIYVSSGSSQWTNVRSYSRATLLEVAASTIRQASYIYMHPTLNKLYAIDTDTSPRDIKAYNILSNGQFIEASYPGGYDSPYHGDYTMFENMRLSPDGRYIFNGAGTVFSSTNSKFDDMSFVYRLNSSFTDVAFDLGSKRFYTMNDTMAGVYDYNNFQQLGLHHLDGNGNLLFNSTNQIIALSVFKGKNIMEYIEKSSIEEVASQVDGLGIKLGGTIADVVYDSTNNKAYAIDEAFRKLIMINLTTRLVEKTLELPYKPSGLTISEDGTKLFIVNNDENHLATEVSLNNFQITRHLTYSAVKDDGDYSDRHIYNRSDNLYIVLGDWTPTLLVFDATTLSKVDSTAISSVGDMVFSSDNSKFYYWYQYGWNAGSAGSDVYANSINGSTFTQVDKSVLGYPNMLRDPLDTPIFLLETAGLVIAKNKVFDMNDLTVVKGSFAEPIYAVSTASGTAVGKTGIYNLSNYQKLETLSLSAAKEIFYGNNGVLYYLMDDVLYSK